MTAQRKGTRTAYLDFLRILAAFLVIVNHTNSSVFKALGPENGVWWLSVLWYYISKTAVPLFVMISGACLLNRVDSYRRIAWRFCRVLLALLLASYVYYLYDAWVFYGLWPRAADVGTFLQKVWRDEFSDGFWYLYFYLGMMLTLPFWQRMAKGMGKNDCRYLLAVTFGVSALWPLIAHYWPQAALPTYIDLPMLCGYVGLFFAGHYIQKYVEIKKTGVTLALVTLAVLLGLCLWLTRLEVARVGIEGKYWFMDDRTAPAFPVIGCALAVMLAAKGAFCGRVSGKALTELGGCAFGVYLFQDLLVAESKARLFAPLCQNLNWFLAALLWEAAVFLAALLVAWVLRRIPVMKKIL